MIFLIRAHRAKTHQNSNERKFDEMQAPEKIKQLVATN